MTKQNIQSISFFVSAILLSVAMALSISFAFAKIAHADGEDYGDVGGYGGDYGDVGGYGGDYGDVGGYGGDYTDVGGYTESCGCDYNGDGVITTEEWSESWTESYSSSGGSGGGFSGGGFSGGGSFGGGSSGGGGGFSMPRFNYPSTPQTFYPPQYPTPTPHPTPTPSPIPAPVTNNTCVNNSCNNTTTTSIVNSGNTTATVYPVQQAAVQYQVQYVQPVQPYCTITISNYNNTNNAYGPYAYNQLATLTWSSTNATSGYVSPNVGAVSAYGSMQVYPTSGSVYTMTVSGQGGTATCSTPVFSTPVYNNPPPVYNNPAPYVSLSQIPYTGFDFGTLGNSIYWLALVLFAGAAAYLVLYFQGGVMAFTGNILGTKKTRVQPEMPRIQVKVSAPVAPVASPDVAPTMELPALQSFSGVVSPIQFAPTVAPEATRTNTTDSMKIVTSEGQAPRIIISRA